MMCFSGETTTHYFSCKRNHSVVAPRMQIQLCLRWRFVLILWGVMAVGEEERGKMVVLSNSPLASVLAVTGGGKEEADGDI